MFAKLLATIVLLAATACGLLVIRQHRLEAGYRAAELHRRIAAAEQAAWALESRIAEACEPLAVLEAVEGHGATWAPLVTSARDGREE